MQGRCGGVIFPLWLAVGFAASGCISPDERQAEEPCSPIKQASAEVPFPKPGEMDKPRPAGANPIELGDPKLRLRELHNAAVARYSDIDSYIARLRRREQNKGKDGPEEVILFKFRKQPTSVYFKFLGTQSQGREVVYVDGKHGNEIHTLLAAGDVPLMPAGKRMSFPIDSILVRSASRHSITDAGIGEIIARCGKLLEASERGDTSIGNIRYLGPVKRPEFVTLLESVEHEIPTGREKELPRGGKRWVMFDPEIQLPVLIVTHDHTGHEVEYYCYDRIEFPVKLDDADFDPEILWPKR